MPIYIVWAYSATSDTLVEHSSKGYHNERVTLVPADMTLMTPTPTTGITSLHRSPLTNES